MIVYHPRKLDILANALSRSKRAELDAENSMTTGGDQAQGIAIMARSPIVALEEVNFWRIAQEKDPVVQDIIQRMRLWEVRSAFALTPQGLLVQEENGQ